MSDTQTTTPTEESTANETLHDWYVGDMPEVVGPAIFSDACEHIYEGSGFGQTYTDCF